MKKLISKFVFVLLLICIILPYGYIVNAKTAIIPKLQIVTQPKSSYVEGDRISFTVTNPNYSGKVQYRVILYNGTTKKTSELWNTPKTGYYYTAWQPAGSYKFTINWTIKGMEPGAYNLTVLVRRAGSKASYDSFIKTNTFCVKSKVDSKFIGDGTEVRATTVNCPVQYRYDNKPNFRNLYFSKGTIITETKYSPTNTNINDNIMFLANKSATTIIYYDNKEYTACFGSSFAIRDEQMNYLTMNITGLFKNNNPHNFEVYLVEVFYDTKTNQYYFANFKHTEFLGANIKKDVPHKVGDVPKLIAIPVQIADF